MIDEILLTKLPTQVSVVPGARLSDYTTFQLGGSCPVLIECPDGDALVQTAALLADEGIDFMVMGQGSNLLVSDSGVHFVVLRYCAEDKPDLKFVRRG